MLHGIQRTIVTIAASVKGKAIVGSFLKRIVSTTSFLMGMNHLANEKSPYLLQHANNPVHWYPWGREAFEKARTTNRLIFLSIGYSTCHWCHVMSHESFENEEVAKILNENFVSIKVDREERPDVDKVYMTFIQVSKIILAVFVNFDEIDQLNGFCTEEVLQETISFQAISGGGGWPLSVFLTPDLKPVTGGTYFPLRDRSGRPGFITLLNIIAEKWRTEDKKMADVAELFLSSMKRSMKPKHRTLPSLEEIEWMCYNHLKDTFDEEHKGFGSAPKFPNCVYLEYLLCFYCVYMNNEASRNALRMVGETLMAIDRGGIHDHIGKGFHRYSVDSRWHVPHFEKMLYDQAQLLAVYAVYHAITGEFIEVIEDIVSYVDSNLTHKSGGFYSAEDADSLPNFNSMKKCEGAYYVWTEKEIDETLSNKPINGIGGLTYAEVFKIYFDIKSNGNVPPYEDPHDELKSQNVLMVKDSHSVCATKCGLSTDNLRNVINEAKSSLRGAQKKRPRPHLDNKIITSWNGLMISGLAKAAIILQNEDLLHRAKRAVDFIKKYSMENGHLLRVAYVGVDEEIVKSDAPIQGYADDYAFLIQGLLDLYEACFDEQLIKLASDLQKEMDHHFWDTKNNSGYHQTAEDPHIIIRIINGRFATTSFFLYQDGAEPSINSVASANLVRLYGITNEKTYHERAQKIFESAAQSLEKYPFALTKMVSALQKHVRPIKQIVVVGSRNNETTKQMLSLISKRFDCLKVLISLDPEKGKYES
uniref:Thioredox_DsbH domain-containing protein n=1 Tax=Elaeophora elaphi TaxID=1147741 RepID=A0A0R3RFR1_9BILA